MKVKKIEKRISDALIAARMTNASFGFGAKTSQDIIATTKPYRDTYIIGPLEEALKLLREGKRHD